MMTSYNIHQQTYVLSSASNILTACTGTQADLQQKITSALQPTITKLEIGDWKVVWGPNVWKLFPQDNRFGPDHTWYIAHNPAANWGDATYDTYVIAIAGTSSRSPINVGEDVNVIQVVDFNKWIESLNTAPSPAPSIDKTKPYVSFGTAFGVHALLNATSPDGTTLTQFLPTIPPTSRIVFTGHSLGGALSPVLALASLKAGLLKGASSNVFAYPTAGPSPGNPPFSKLFASALPLTTAGSKAYQVWNANIWNSHDIVPHAWCINGFIDRNLWKIPLIYGILPDKLLKTVTAAVAIAAGIAAKSGLAYVPLPGSKFTTSKPSVPQTFDAFLAQAGHEHVEAYRDFFGTPSVPPLCSQGDAVDEAKHLPVLEVLYYSKLASEASEEEKAEREQLEMLGA